MGYIILKPDNGMQSTTKRLSDLANGEAGYIVSIGGDGAFRKRINEMGFTPGQRIIPIKKAPLQDPVEYEIMGYRLSLRSSEASLIEVELSSSETQSSSNNGMVESGDYVQSKEVNSKVLRVALVGNPNCGKTTLFNQLTGANERVGNYGGVTVDQKRANFKYKGQKIQLIDLPGTYSLSEYSAEELYVRECLNSGDIDIVINVVDTSNIERNLFLTTQLIDLNLKTIVALNMYDELERSGDKFEYDTLAEMLSLPFIPTSASKGEGLNLLLDRVVDMYENTGSKYRHLHINFGADINSALEVIRQHIKQIDGLREKFHTQYLAIKLLEQDAQIISLVASYSGSKELLEVSAIESRKIESHYKDNSGTVVANARYSFIRGALKETYSTKHEFKTKGYGIDKILTNKWLGLPIFLFILFAMFELTFTVGGYPQEWIESGLTWLSEAVSSLLPTGIIRDMVVDGIIAGVGAVLIFFPNILILFAFIAILEDSGYMARVAFLMDRLMHKIGLHGKSFIPMLIGFGCNVPAVMATRTLENRKDRILTMLIVPFMSCSARLPVYVLLISAFFSAYSSLILLGVYLAGILVSILSALIFKKLIFKGKEAPFVMELPPYRVPLARNSIRHTWLRSREYLTKMGGIILVASILIWVLSYFPRNEQIDPVSGETVYVGSDINHSYLADAGRFITPVLEPLGYDWKLGVSLVTGVAAKEVVVSTMAVLYNSDEEALTEKIQDVRLEGEDGVSQGYTKTTILSFMIFVLLYAPCIAVVAAIAKEASRSWALFSVVYSTVIAWVCAYIVVLVGKLF